MKQKIHNVGDEKAYRGPEEFFTGAVTIQPIFESHPDMPVSAGYVTFEAGARTAWHTHPCGQRLLVTEGVGLVGEWEGSVREFSVGDVITCPADVKHWQGASPNQKMTHMAITGVKNGQAVKWMEKVTDEQYRGEA